MFNVMIVDDERLARAELKRLLTPHDKLINIVAEAANAETALALLQEKQIDLVFLDVQMPGMSGVEMAEKINSDVAFIFCTAFDQYAVDAFSLNAIDYLVKPINPDRLTQSLQKLEKQQNLEKRQKPPEENSVKEQSEKQGAENWLPDHHGVMLKFGEINRIVKLQDIERFESIGNHCAVYSSAGKSWVHSSLSRIEMKLDPMVFFKANRSEVIRLDTIERIEPGIKTGSSLAILKSGTEVEISRRQAQQLKQFFSAF